MTKMNEQNLMDKVQKLLSLAGNNPNEHEAQAAYAKAQALIAEYNLDMSKATGEKIEFVAKLCKHSNNEGYRKPLAVVIADNFRVKTFMRGNTVCFFGMKQDVEDEWNNTIAPTLRRGHGGVRTYGSDSCYQKGYEDGKEHMRSTKSLNQ